jgi:uncharacterized protein YydD (DUF2326 family)
VNNIDYYNKAINRYLHATHDKCDRDVADFYADVIVFLEKEISRYCDKIEELNDRMNTMYGARTAEEVTKKLEEWRREQDALTTRVEQLGQIVENKMDKLLGETVQTLTTFTEERTSDGGVMTLATHTNTNAVQEVLLQNGYFVCSHIDDEPNEQDEETITIEFWKE